MWILTATILLLTPTILHAADLCDAGYYLTDAGECAQCGHGGYYCPGDNIRYDCPDKNSHINSDWPDAYYNPTIYTVLHYTENNPSYTQLKSAPQCSVQYWLNNTRGQLYTIRRYNETTGLYDTPTSSWGWTDANPGYYLTNPKACHAYAYYYNASECLPGAYCPGQAKHVCTNYTQPNDFGLYVCDDNSYSDAGATTCTPCPAGTGNHGDTRTEHAGITSCLPLCGAGATKLNIGKNTFNLWPTNKCTSPSLRVSINDDVCCVNMAQGHGPGINTELHDKIYHTTN